MTTDTEARALVERLTGFTPGPWWTGGNYSGREMGTSVIAAREDAGPLPGNPTRGQVAFATALLNTEARTSENNARLIAAAPDMHRLLTALLAENERLRVAANAALGYSISRSAERSRYDIQKMA